MLFAAVNRDDVVLATDVETGILIGPGASLSFNFGNMASTENKLTVAQSWRLADDAGRGSLDKSPKHWWRAISR